MIARELPAVLFGHGFNRYPKPAKVENISTPPWRGFGSGRASARTSFAQTVERPSVAAFGLDCEGFARFGLDVVKASSLCPSLGV